MKMRRHVTAFRANPGCRYCCYAIQPQGRYHWYCRSCECQVAFLIPSKNYLHSPLSYPVDIISLTFIHSSGLANISRSIDSTKRTKLLPNILLFVLYPLQVQLHPSYLPIFPHSPPQATPTPKPTHSLTHPNTENTTPVATDNLRSYTHTPDYESKP